MSMQFSDSGTRNANAVNADEDFVTLLEFYKEGEPARAYVCDDVEKFVGFGHEWIACPFEMTLPDDVDQQTPVGNLSINNVPGEELDDGFGNKRRFSQWLEEIDGGKDMKVIVRQTLRSEPFIEFEMELDLSNIVVKNDRVTAQISYTSNSRNNHATGLYFTPETAPGIY